MIEQGTPEWHQQRLGKATASRIADIIAKTKTGYSTSRANYAAQLIAERLTSVPSEGFSSVAMQWGTETEPEARSAYSFYSGHDVDQIGFIEHPTITMSGASPDGLISDAGLVEIKCPITATHIDTLRTGRVPGKYITQIMWQLACTGRQWCDFVSYDPRMPEHMRLFVKRVARMDDDIKVLESEVFSFLAEIEATIADLKAKYPEAS